jgi:diguanylate cyclase (GGDEF)-like protein
MQARLQFTTSIGVASLSEGDAHIETFLNKADQALYKAKHEGRNRVFCSNAANV